MAASLFRTGRQLLLASSRINIIRARLVSTSSNKQAEISTESQQQTSVEHPLPRINYRSPTQVNTQSHSETGKQYLDNYQLQNRPQDDVLQGFCIQNESPTSNDPLQHIIDHPAATIILRDACKCTKCKDQGTSQREFNLSQIPIDLKPSKAEQDAQGNWIIQWQNDMPGWEDHISIFTPKEIDRLTTYMAKEHQSTTRLWDRQEYTAKRFTISYDEYMHTDAGLAKTLYFFAQHGLVFIKDIPHEDADACIRLANRISHMKSTFYGPTWDIRSIPDAKNVAYTAKYLGFHSDLIYLKEPPTVQYLHCIHNSATGGESRFVDQFKALDTLYSEDPTLGSALAATRLRYEYDNDSYYYSDIKPIVQWRTDSHQFPRRTVRGATNPGPLSSVYRVYWAPQFLGSIMSNTDTTRADLELSITAMRRYAEILEREDMVFQEKMEPGTCVMFDNLRVLHARNAFENSAKRWLRGTYVDGQDLWSLEVKYGELLKGFEREVEDVRELD